ncbi:MAG: response regulator [Myxococcota bacterium]|nr:response regulator [Myxococcota bacterium]
MSETDIRVLIVDDEEELIGYMSKRLLREGFTVRATTSGEDAVKALENEDFDVAIIDLKMPGMNGIETQTALKGLRPHLQTIVLTGHGSLDAAFESGKQNAFKFMAKPAEHDELVRTLHEAAEAKTKLATEAFREEMDELTRGGVNSPRSLLKAMDELRKKHGLD